MAVQLFANNISTTLSSAITSTGQTSFSIASSTGVPTPSGGSYFYGTISDSAETIWEVVKVTANSSGTLTVARAQDGTTAQASWPVGSIFSIRQSAQMFRDFSDVGLNLNPVANPTTGSAAIVLAAGNLGSGAYNYLVTFITPSGETNCYNIGTVTTDGTHQQVQVTIPVSTDYRVTGRKLYRTVVGGANYNAKYLATVSDNTTTGYTDNIADGSLGAGGGWYQANTTISHISLFGVRTFMVDANATYLGQGAGVSITSGGRNTFLGYNAGTATADGQNNTFVGDSAGQANTSGTSNTYIGWGVASAITTGNYNVFGGYQCGAALTGSSGNNVGLGWQCLYVSGAYNYNTAIGNKAGNAAAGSNGVFLGNMAGAYETSGSALYIDGLDRTNNATGKTNSLIYGVMNATPASQTLQLGGGGVVTVNGTQASSSTTTGALVVSGGLGIAGAVYIGGTSIQAGAAIFNSTINKITLTAPATAATLTLANNSTLTTSGAYVWQFTVPGAFTYTLPGQTDTLAGLGGTNTWSAAQTFSSTINKVTITAPATSATLTLVTGSTLATAGAFVLTLTTTVASTPTFPSGAGTLTYLAGANTWTGAQTFNTAVATFALTDVHTLGATLTASAAVATAGYIGQDSTQKALGTYQNGIKQMAVGCIFTQTATGTNGANTAITNILGTGVGTAVLPASWTLIGKTIRVRAWGTVTTAAAPGTTIISLYFNAGTPVTLVASPSMTLLASMTNMPFLIELDAIVRTTTTIITGGQIVFPNSTTGVTSTVIPVGQAAVATVVAATSYTINVSATNGTASGTVYTTQGSSIEILN